MLIFVNCPHGLGNKIFDLLIALYIQHLNGGQIYFANVVSPHDKESDPKIADIFPELLKHVNFVTEKELYQIKDKYKDKKEKVLRIKEENIKILDDLSFKGKYEGVYLRNIFFLYKYIYRIFLTLKSNIIQNFKINPKLIPKEIKAIGDSKYAAIHIRYGDKLKIISNINKKYDYLLPHPRFYLDVIREFVNNDIKVYIFTDDEKIVKKYIIDKIPANINLDKIKLLSVPNYQAFYLLCNAQFMVLSTSSFSMLAALLNKKLKKACLVTRTKEIERFGPPEEKFIKETNWNICPKREYILNFDRNLIKKMLNNY